MAKRSPTKPAAAARLPREGNLDRVNAGDASAHLGSSPQRDAEDAARLRELGPLVPRELDNLAARMLARSPEDRPARADVIGAELLTIEESEPRPLIQPRMNGWS